jgi:hypothetical protein
MPDIRVVAFGDAVKDGVKLKRLKVEYKSTESSGALTFYFHAAEGWLLHSYLIEPGTGYRDRRPTLFHFSYKVLDGETVLQRNEVYRIGPGGVQIPWGTHDYEWERASPPDSEFTLTQFGLPEAVNFAPRRSTPLYVWILSCAAGCAALAFLFRFLARRRTTATPPPATTNGMLTPARLFRLLFLAALGLFVVGGVAGIYLWLCTPPGLVVHDIRRDLGEVPLETYVRLDFPVTNTSDRPMRIFGFAGG